MEKLRRIKDYLLERLGEPSTWQGIGFLIALSGSKFGLGVDWGQAAVLGGMISAILKMIFADKK